MARRPISMRKTKEILRLKHELGLTNRQIASSLNLSHTCVGEHLQQAKAVGIGWPFPADLDEEKFRQLMRATESPPSASQRPLPPMEQVHRELQRKGVTLHLLWEEYRRLHPEGYGYTQFCEYYRRFCGQLEPALRQTHPAGERMFVDWAGMTVPLWDAHTGQSRPAHVFVAVLGASNYTFAEAFENMRLPAWIEAHIHAWEFYGGVTRLTVPDNAKTGVSYACRYDPELTSSYQELATHYGTVVLPARPKEPQDKAKVEAGVQHAERRILAALRDQKFFSLGELNAAIRRELHSLNERPFQKLPGSRASVFVELDKPALLPLPATRYELATWRQAKVNIDYHIQVDWHNYSVPYRFIQQTVEVRFSERTVEIFARGQRIALHPRSHQQGGFTTDPAHRPKSHQQHLEWTPSRLIGWAERQVGPQCAAAVRHILEHKPHPEMGYRSCLGLMRLGRQHGRHRLEQACQRALLSDLCTYPSIKSILDSKLETQPLPTVTDAPLAPVAHDNLRGSHYYQ
jgi:transposase